MFCRNCKEELPREASICMICGFDPLVHTAYCQRCGEETDAKMKVCNECGVILKTSTESGTIRKNDGEYFFSKNKRVRLFFKSKYYTCITKKLYMNNEQQSSTPPPITKTVTEQPDLSMLDKYYQAEFKKIIESGEKYKGKWNWYSFLFSWIWCFSKGCWGYGILTLVATIFSFGAPIYPIVVVLIALIMGFRGTWIYYNVKMKSKQIPKSF